MTESSEKPNRKRRIDWSAIRSAYIEGSARDPDGDPNERVWPTLRALAETYGVSPFTVDKRSAAENWTKQRERHQSDVERARRERLVQERASRASTIDSRGLSSAEAGLALVGHRLAFMLRRAQQQPADQAGADRNARELSSLALAAWRFVRVKDAVMGVPQPDEQADEATLEREQRLDEELLAARVALRAAERLAPVDVDTPHLNGH